MNNNEIILLPELLYKYRSLNKYAERMLRYGEIYFATTNELNDSFERFFYFQEGDYVNGLTDSERKEFKPIKRLSEKLDCWLLNSEDYTKHILNGKNEWEGIFCLCGNKKSIPMYAYYADGFKGIAIGFDSQKLKSMFIYSSFPNNPVLYKVQYLPNPPIITGKHITRDEFITISTTKTLDYDHEDEWRMFHKKGVWSGYDIKIVSISAEDCKGSTLTAWKQTQRKGDILFIRNASDKSCSAYLLCDKQETIEQRIETSSKFYEILSKINLPDNMLSEAKKEDKKAIRKALRDQVLFKNVDTSFSNKNNIVRKAIKEIIFGDKVDSEDKKKVREWVKDLDVKFFEAKPIIGKFELEIVPDNPSTLTADTKCISDEKMKLEI